MPCACGPCACKPGTRSGAAIRRNAARPTLFEPGGRGSFVVGSDPAAALYDLVDRHEGRDPVRRHPLHRRRALITGAALVLAILAARRLRWPLLGGRILLAALLLGLGYTVFSEWLNVSVRQSWSYTEAMPLLPPFGTGLAPFLQWLVVPGLAFATAVSWGRRRLLMRRSPPSP